MNSNTEERKILQVIFRNRGYNSKVYKVKWRGNYTEEEIINAIDSGNYGGFIEKKKETENTTTAIVTVYTD